MVGVDYFHTQDQLNLFGNIRKNNCQKQFLKVQSIWDKSCHT